MESEKLVVARENPRAIAAFTPVERGPNKAMPNEVAQKSQAPQSALDRFKALLKQRDDDLR
ncbi:hypothetical protein TIFTF001_053221, partial [Ficus carica]